MRIFLSESCDLEAKIALFRVPIGNRARNIKTIEPYIAYWCVSESHFAPVITKKVEKSSIQYTYAESVFKPP